MKNTFQTIHSLHQAAEGSIVELRGKVAGDAIAKDFALSCFEMAVDTVNAYSVRMILGKNSLNKPSLLA